MKLIKTFANLPRELEEGVVIFREVKLVIQEVPIDDGKSVKIGLPENLRMNFDKHIFVEISPAVLLSIVKRSETSVIYFWGELRGAFWRIGQLEFREQSDGIYWKMWPWTLQSRGLIMKLISENEGNIPEVPL